VSSAASNIAQPTVDGFDRLYINDTAYFDGVPEADGNYHIGGYQVCHKWLSITDGILAI